MEPEAVLPAALPGDNAPDARTLRRRLQGLLFFRLLLAVLFLILTLIAQIGREEGFLSVRLQPLYYFSCTLFLFTLLAALGLDRVRCLRRYAQWQLLFDVGAVTVLIYLSGGLESFFSFLYMPVIISSALLLDGRGSVLIASVCSLAYGLLMDLQYFGWVAPLQIIGGTVQLKDSSVYFHTILMNIAGFYLVAYLSGYLARELHKSSLQVREQKKDFHELEILHRNIVHSMGSGLLTTATDGSIVFSNHAARRILGLPSDRLEGQSFSRIFTELDPSSWLVKRPLSGTSPGDLDRREVLYKKPTGEELCLGYTVSVLQREEGDASGWVFIFQDLTQLKAMAEHVQRMERLAFAGRIASEIAHEIKNPLAAMSGAVQMLQSEAVADPLQSRLMNIVAREIDRIDSLVRDFLWLSRGAHQPESLENVSLCRIVEEMLSLMESREKITPVHRIQTFMEGNPVCLLDVHHVRQILWNLIVNALEAMPEGGELTLTVSSGGQGNGERAEARVDIRDTGCGIPPEIRDRVFEPFFTTKEKGTGLGLGIVYQLVERAGGRIEITHHELSGTTFSLFFPSNVSLPLAN